MFCLHLYDAHVQRETWTDERLDDMSRHVDQRFDQVEQRFDQVDQRFDRVEGDLRELRAEMRGEFGSTKGEIAELRSLIYRFGTGTIGAIVVATLLHGI